MKFTHIDFVFVPLFTSKTLKKDKSNPMRKCRDQSYLYNTAIDRLKLVINKFF